MGESTRFKSDSYLVAKLLKKLRRRNVEKVYVAFFKPWSGKSVWTHDQLGSFQMASLPRVLKPT